jgi:hypothetical protein
VLEVYVDNPQEPKDEIEERVTTGDDAVPAAGRAAGAGGGDAAPAAVDGGGSNGDKPVPAAAGGGGADGGNVVPAGGDEVPPAVGDFGGPGGANSNKLVRPGGGGTGTSGGSQTVDVKNAVPSIVPDTRVIVTEIKPPANMTIGKRLTLWMLSILAGSILLLVLYLWSMEKAAGDDIRRNYGKDLNRDDLSLYMAQRIQRFSNDLANAQKDPSFVAPKNNASDDKALSETLGLLPDITDEQRSQLAVCVSLISSKEATGDERKTKLQPCIGILEQTKSEGTTAAVAAMSFQMASEASAKLLEERQNLHEFWLKAAQLILLNLLLPVLTAVIGYTFGNNQANQSQGTSQQGSSQ